jgi:hypothetical protein
MRKNLLSIAAVLAMVFVAAPAHSADLTVPIVVSPSTLNLAYQGVWVTVHAEIDYVDVLGATVTLNFLDVKWLL